MYKLKSLHGRARRGEFETVHGTVQTPAFMNVATAGAIKGALSAYDLKDIDCQVQLCNTYHMHLRPGEEVRLLDGQNLWEAVLDTVDVKETTVSVTALCPSPEAPAQDSCALCSKTPSPC